MRLRLVYSEMSKGPVYVTRPDPTNSGWCRKLKFRNAVLTSFVLLILYSKVYKVLQTWHARKVCAVNYKIKQKTWIILKKRKYFLNIQSKFLEFFDPIQPDPTRPAGPSDRWSSLRVVYLTFCCHTTNWSRRMRSTRNHVTWHAT